MKFSLLFLISAVLCLNGVCFAAKQQSLKDKHLKQDQQSAEVYDTYKHTSLNNNPISKIGIERTFCYGTCPAYQLIVHRSGKVSYTGYGHVKRQGEHSGSIPSYHLRSLFAYINESDFFNLKNSYSYPITDNSSTYTLVVKAGREKIIKNYANAGPLTLWSIEQHIDSLLPLIEWD